MARLGTSFFGGILLILLAFRVSQLGKLRVRKYLVPASIAIAYSVFITVSGNQTALLLYPVLINLILLYVFASSTYGEKTILEEIAEQRGAQMGPGSRSYLKTLNLIWCLFFGLNAMASGYTAYFRPIEDWALYNGFVSYILIGILILGELTVRPIYKRAMQKRERNTL